MPLSTHYLTPDELDTMVFEHIEVTTEKAINRMNATVDPTSLT